MPYLRTGKVQFPPLSTRHSGAVMRRWRERQALQAVAGRLTQEFERSAEGVGFRVKAHGRRRLELLAWPEGGLDNFFEAADDPEAIEHASNEFRRIVGLYASGLRPPF